MQIHSTVYLRQHTFEKCSACFIRCELVQVKMPPFLKRIQEAIGIELKLDFNMFYPNIVSNPIVSNPIAF